MPYDEKEVSEKINQIISAHDKLILKATELKQVRYNLLGLQPVEHTIADEDGKAKTVKKERIYGKTGKPFTKKEKDELADEYLSKADDILMEVKDIVS